MLRNRKQASIQNLNFDIEQFLDLSTRALVLTLKTAKNVWTENAAAGAQLHIHVLMPDPDV
jgi:hypothetical protein